MQQNIVNPIAFSVILKQRSKNNFIQKWNAEINESLKAIFYRAFTNFQLQKHFNIAHVAKSVTSHRLELDKGRWARPGKIAYENKKYGL